MPEYVVEEGGLHERFLRSRKPIQLIGGGFANGKTAAVSVKSLDIAKNYPAANILMARSTYPKLNDTLRKEFIKWAPKKWIKSFPLGQNGPNACTLSNDSVFNFRYVQQTGKASGEATTSNLLSATYDLAVIDQVEDPEITEKDFKDVMGRMRGGARYIGHDPTMPKTGPGWILLTCNPTRNWVFSKIVRPLKVYEMTGRITDELLCLRNGKTLAPVLDAEGKPHLLVDLFEGSTYENEHNLRPDFIQLLESSYTGQMRDRFLLGEWAAYEGLVYNAYSDITHALDRTHVMNYMRSLRDKGYKITWLEGYDYGMASPACYLLAFVDPFHNIIIIDGFHQNEMTIAQTAERIASVRSKYNVPVENIILADPDIFRRGKPGTTQTTGEPISALFFNTKERLMMGRGNNNIKNGITKVRGYLAMVKSHQHPLTGDFPAPHLYIIDDLEFVANEFGSYYWKQDNGGIRSDDPVDKNDHAMDTIKYMLTYEPEIAYVAYEAKDALPPWMLWHEEETRNMERR